MPNFIAYIGATVLGAFGATAAAASFGLSLAVGIATVSYVTATALRAFKLRKPGDGGAASGGQQLLVRSTTEPRKIVYGEAVVSGPVVFMNTADGSGPNSSLYVVVALTGHEIDSFQGFYVNDKLVPIADVDTAGDGAVDADTADHGFGPALSIPTLYLRGHTGSSTQTVDTMLDSAFTEWTSDHRGRGVAYFVARMEHIDQQIKTWENGAPNNMSALVRGKKVYDPRLDSTFTGSWGAGSGAHRVADPTTWAYSSNPALCLADYLIDDDLGAGEDFDPTDIDYNSVAIAADDCEDTVAIPTSATEARFTCNGVLTCSDDHRPNIANLLSSMSGTLRYYNGLWRISAGVWPASSSFALTESDLVGDITFQPQPDRTERFNAVRGVYFDPDRLHKETAYLAVEDTSLQTNRDDGLVIWKELDLPMTNSETMAQRIAMRALEEASRTGVCIFPMGYRGMDIAPGDRGTVSISELGWSSKNFRCIGIRHVDMVGVELVLKEDDSGAYDDPLEAEYGTRSASAVITFPRFQRSVVERVINDDFEYLSAAELHMRWTKRQGGIADGDISLVTGLTDVPGGQAVRFGNNSGNDEWWGALTSVLMQFDPLSTFEVGVIVRRNFGSGTFYCGVECVANDRTTLINTSGSNAYTSAHYIAASNAAPSSAWTTYKGYLRGHGTSFSHPNNDPSAPSTAYTGTTFIRPMMLVNSSAAAGQMDVAAIWLRRIATVGYPDIGPNAAEEVVSAQPSDGTHTIGTVSNGGSTLTSYEPITNADVSWQNTTGDSVDVLLRLAARVALSASDSIVGRKLAMRWSVNGGSSWSYDTLDASNPNIVSTSYEIRSTQRTVTVAPGETLDVEAIVVVIIPPFASGDPADVLYAGLSLSVEAIKR